MHDSAAPIRMLVVEDEGHLAAGLKLNFELDGFAVDVAATGREASALLVDGHYDVIVLDIMLPDIDGFVLCRKLREAGNFTPVIMLTARDTADDRVRGLDVGADDYLTKPFALEELRARVRSALRRQNWDKSAPVDDDGPTTLAFGQARIDFETHDVSMAGEVLHLTHLEMELLRYFAKNPGRVIGRDELLEKVWRLRNYPNTRTVDNFIVRLRRYFEPDPVRPIYFVSVRGSGYKFVPEG